MNHSPAQLRAVIRAADRRALALVAQQRRAMTAAIGAAFGGDAKPFDRDLLKDFDA